MFHVDVEQLPILQEKLEKTKADLERLAQEGTSRIRSTQQILDESYQRAYYYERAISDRIDDINREISNLRYRSSSDDETVADRLDSLYREEQECREEYWAAQDATRDARRRSESFARESSSYQLLQRCIVEDYFDTVNKSAVFLEKYRTLVLNSQSVLENQSVESYHKIPNDLPEVPEHIGLKIISRYTGNRETVIDVNNPYRMSGDLDKANQWLNKYSESLPGNDSGSVKGVEFSFAEIPASSATEASGLMKLDIQRFAITLLDGNGKDYFNFDLDEYLGVPEPMRECWKENISPETHCVKRVECSTKIGGVEYVSDRVVYQMVDFDPYTVDSNGYTNEQRIRNGWSPVDSRGRVIQLHHLIQEEPGALLEVPEDVHDDGNWHGLKKAGESFRNDEILNKQFNNFKRQYWRWRLNQKLKELNERKKE